jgi:Carbohydrate binding domain (family 25).
VTEVYDHGFQATILLPQNAAALEVFFKDSAGNWDNNSGSNYIFEIETNKKSSWDNLGKIHSDYSL